MKITELFTTAYKHGASDLHLAVGQPPIIRVDDVLQSIQGLAAVTNEDMETVVKEICSKEQIAKFTDTKELDLSYAIEGLSRFRVNLHRERGHIGLVARVIAPLIPTLEDVGLPEIVKRFCNQETGFVLVTGPAGSGKSTSLAAMINYINNTQKAHIITLEDPIEFVYESKQSLIRQRQLDSDMDSFPSALKHVLRQDPDVIMVGEMRDLETIATTITLAETGHLVFATLHTHNAIQSIDRIIDIFPPYQQAQIRLQLSMSLVGIISQRLLPRIGGGRVASREILVCTPAISNIIRENKITQLRTVLQTGSEFGMVTLEQDLRRLIRERVIAKEAAEGVLGYTLDNT